MNKKISIFLIIIVLLAAVSVVSIYYKKPSIQTSTDDLVSEIHDDLATTTPIVKETIKKDLVPSLSYLFESEPRNPTYSNIVGYFAGGAFAWYVPDWLVENWKIDNSVNNSGMLFTPKEPISNSPISDIAINVSTSTEDFNAETLFEKEKLLGNVIIAEILLNKHAEGDITLIIETTTRIYHVQSERGGRVHEMYFMDGNNKTAQILFSSDKENFQSYVTKIRDMVEGIGEAKSPQG